jgi:hypothetical protein
VLIVYLRLLRLLLLHLLAVMLLAARALPTVASKQQEQRHISTTLRSIVHQSLCYISTIL